MLLRRPTNPSEIYRKGTREVAHRAAGSLSGADLRRADLRRGNLRNRDLSWADLSGASLAGADLRKANLAHAILDGCDLSDADLRDARLDGARFIAANLQRAQLPHTIYGVDFSSADLRQARNPDRDKWVQGHARCAFDGSDLRDTDLRGWLFSECSFRDADLRGARMRGIPWRRRLALTALAQIPGTAPYFVSALAPHSDLAAFIARGRHPSGLTWDHIAIAGLVLGMWLLFGLRAEASFQDCTFDGARYSEATRWPKRFALRPADPDEPSDNEGT